MRKLNSLFTLTLTLTLTFALCLIIASCDDKHDAYPEEPKQPVTEEPGTDEPDPEGPTEPQVAFWKHSHLAFIGLNGAVQRVTERSYSLSEDEDEEATVFFEARFNADGMLTYYNSTGIEPQPQTRAGVWQTLSYYAYEYGEDGRMSKVIVTPLGESPVEYTLEYGDHTTYVPLIFPVGPMDFFLVQGLQSITSTNQSATSAGNPLQYTFDGTKATYTEETWMGQVKTVFEYADGSAYPMRKTAVTTLGGELQSTEDTLYEYDEAGRLLSIDYKATDSEGKETERTITRYYENKLLLLKTRISDVDGINMDWSYTYDDSNRPLQFDFVMGKGSEDEVRDNETYEYLVTDVQGNWTDSKQKQSSFVNSAHLDGEVGVCREIVYHDN